MRTCDSNYDRGMASNVTALIEALRQAGHTVECPVTGAVIVDGERCDKFESAAVNWDGTEEGLADLGW